MSDDLNLARSGGATPSLRRGSLLQTRTYLAAGLGYLALAAAALYTLVINFTTATPGSAGENADFAQFHWNIWWFQHAIFQLGRDPYFTNYILFPFNINLAYHTLTPLLNVLALPIYATLGLTAALNSWIIGSLVFNGLAMFAFLRHHRVSPGLAFVGGAAFAFTSATMSRVSFVHLSMTANGWLPLSLLAWDWLIERRRWPWAVLLGVVLYATLLTDIQFIVWLALLLPLYALYTLIKAERQTRKHIVTLGILAVVVFIGLSLIAPLPQLVAGMGNKYGEEFQGIIEDWYSTHFEDLIAFPPRYPPSERATLGLLLPLGLMIGLFTGRKVQGRWFWLAVGLLFLVLAFGPTLTPWGIPLPFRLFYALAGGTYRVAARFLLPAVMCFIVFVALSLQPWYQRLGRLGTIGLVGGALFVLAVESRWYEPLPTFTMPDYPIYHQIGAEPGEFLILEVPVGPHNLFRGVFGKGGVLQYYAPIHHKQLINGAVSRAPEGLTQSYQQWPLIAALAEEAPMPDLSAARAEFARLNNEWHMQYVLIHRDMLESETATFAAGLMNTQTGWCFAGEEGPILIYTRIGHAACAAPDQLNLPSGGTLDLGNGHEQYLGSGWYYTETIGGLPARWLGREVTTTLRVNLPVRDYRVKVTATTIAPDQVVSVYVNDQRVADLSIGSGWNDYAFDVPAVVLSPDQLTTIDLVPAKRHSPQELTNGQSSDQRPLAAAISALQFEAR
jgi:hypothetical protein